MQAISLSVNMLTCYANMIHFTIDLYLNEFFYEIVDLFATKNKFSQGRLLHIKHTEHRAFMKYGTHSITYTLSFNVTNILLLR